MALWPGSGERREPGHKAGLCLQPCSFPSMKPSPQASHDTSNDNSKEQIWKRWGGWKSQNVPRKEVGFTTYISHMGTHMRGGKDNTDIIIAVGFSATCTACGEEVTAADFPTAGFSGGHEARLLQEMHHKFLEQILSIYTTVKTYCIRRCICLLFQWKHHYKHLKILEALLHSGRFAWCGWQIYSPYGLRDEVQQQ